MDAIEKAIHDLFVAARDLAQEEGVGAEARATLAEAATLLERAAGQHHGSK